MEALSEQGRVLFEAIFDHINLVKKQQWTITNYAALILAAIFLFAKELDDLSHKEKVVLSLMSLAVSGFGTLMLIWVQTDLSEARTRLDVAIEGLFKKQKERNLLGIEKENEAFSRGLEFTFPMLVVIWVGAAMVIYYLWRSV